MPRSTLSTLWVAALALALPLAPARGQGTDVRPIPKIPPYLEDETRAVNPILILPNAVLSYCNENLYCRGGNRKCIEETFLNFSGPSPGVQWRLCIGNQGEKGYEIGPVLLRYGPAAPWLYVLYRAGLAEFFTAYHSGAPHFYDTRFADATNWRRPLTPVDATDAQNPILVTLSGDSTPYILAETRDRGLAWVCKGSLASLSRVRRGQELVLWGVYDTGNYDYIIEYGFRDDGTITFRLGATGFNSPDQPFAAHMHDALWRVDMDLNRAGDDRALLTRHSESAAPNPAGALDEELPFNGGFEGFANWNPLEFTTLLVEDPQLNAFGHNIGYEMEPFWTGSARHYCLPGNNPSPCPGETETWSQHDFWVSIWHPEEDSTGANSWFYPWRPPDLYLDQFTSAGNPAGRESVTGDVVLWHHSSAHHEPSDEDRAIGDPSDDIRGVTLMHWQGFDLVPHDLFNHNPLDGPLRCEP